GLSDRRREAQSVTGPVRVGIVLGSDSDLDVMLEAVKVLDALEVGSEVVVTSAHRTPERTHEYATTAHARGLGVLIAGAGGAAALPRLLAAASPLPVIGVPIAATPLGGMDALLSIVQMPKGVPVATVAIGKWGAANAGLLAAQILAAGDPALATRIAAYRKRLADEVDERARKVAAQMKSGGPPKAGTAPSPSARAPPPSIPLRPLEPPCAPPPTLSEPAAWWRCPPRRSTDSPPPRSTPGRSDGSSS